MGCIKVIVRHLVGLLAFFTWVSVEGLFLHSHHAATDGNQGHESLPAVGGRRPTSQTDEMTKPVLFSAGQA